MSTSTLLCLACSSCLPPRSNVRETFFTPCCRQPICDACISSNPRLTRYNPCLLCLAGVDAVGPSTKVKGKEGLKVEDKNVDGAVRDQDTFVLGDDDDEDNDDDQDSATGKPSALNDSSASAIGAADEQETQEVNKAEAEQPKELDPDSATPRRAQYHIKRGDTLQGIIFKFGVNREELCRLNRLPLSTLTTTPHLLHTRTVLLLPSSARITGKENITFLDEATPSRTEEDEKRAVRRAREKAEKRLQTVTKEVDWAVAKAYVALAETPGEEEAYALKMKEQPSARVMGGSSLEAVAVDRYLDDLEWEANEFKAGRGVSIPRIPPSIKI